MAGWRLQQLVGHILPRQATGLHPAGVCPHQNAPGTPAGLQTAAATPLADLQAVKQGHAACCVSAAATAAAGCGCFVTAGTHLPASLQQHQEVWQCLGEQQQLLLLLGAQAKLCVTLLTLQRAVCVMLFHWGLLP